MTFNNTSFIHKKNKIWYTSVIDFPNVDQLSKDQIFLNIQGWIASDEKISNINLPSIHKFVLLDTHRPDVQKVYPNKFVKGFNCLLKPEEIILLPNKPKISFKTGNIKDHIELNIHLIKTLKQYARQNIQEIKKIRKIKLAKIKPYLSCPVCKGDLTFKIRFFICKKCKSIYPNTKHTYNFLTPKLRSKFSIINTDNISSNAYGGVLDKVIYDSNKLILDCGAGSKNHMSQIFPNVINLEIADYYSTDVLGVGEKLPFKDNTFDAVLSLAVLEHVKNPFLCAQEIVRVLKPGGKLLCQVPFLQPYHGYPHHYYNMSETGLINLFSGMKIDSCSVPLNGHPIFSLTWFLNEWCQGLKEEDLNNFKNLKIKDLLEPGQNYLQNSYVKNLNEKAQKIIASVNFLIATKSSKKHPTRGILTLKRILPNKLLPKAK